MIMILTHKMLGIVIFADYSKKGLFDKNLPSLAQKKTIHVGIDSLYIYYAAHQKRKIEKKMKLRNI